MKISVCYSHRFCKWKSVYATGTGSVDENQCMLQPSVL